MTYNKNFVADDTQFSLRQSFTIKGGTERKLDRGKMASLTISTADFETLTGLIIHPFKTEPFINGTRIHARKLSGTAYTECADDRMSLNTAYGETIEGTSSEIDRGSLAAYNLGLAAFDEVLELEVRSG